MCMFLVVRGITITSDVTIHFAPSFSVKTIAPFVTLPDTQASPCRTGLMKGGPMTRAGPLGEAGGMLRIGVAIRKVGATEIHGKLEALPWFHAALKLQQHSG